MHRLARRIGFAVGGLHLAALGSVLALSGALCVPAACSSACDAFQPDTVAGVKVKVRLVNQTGHDLFFDFPQSHPFICGGLAFALTDAVGNVVNWAGGGPCEFTCEGLMNDSCQCVGVSCASFPITRVVPGGTYEAAVWNGLIFRSATLPDGCASTACSAAQPGKPRGHCLLETAPSAGELTLTATAYPAIQGCGTTPLCTCTPGPTGACDLRISDFGGSGSGPPVQAKATLASVTATTVDIVFH